MVDIEFVLLCNKTKEPEECALKNKNSGSLLSHDMNFIKRGRVIQ